METGRNRGKEEERILSSYPAEGIKEMEGGKIEEYEVIEQLQQGSYGSTFLVFHKTNKTRYVMKKIKLAKQTDKFRKTAQQEMALIARLRNPYIIEYKDSWVDEENIYIVTAYCGGGTMEEKIRKARRVLFPEERICKWFTQLLLAIDYLYSNRVIHQNIECSNIFITEEGDVRLGHVGFAKLLSKEDLASSGSGTSNYLCPELLEGVPYGYKSDIWSLGCCMFEIVAHQAAFRATDMAGLFSKINRSCISPLPPVYSPSLKRMIKSMLRKNSEHRPTAAELLRHPHLETYLAKSSNPSPFLLPIKKNPSTLADKATKKQYHKLPRSRTPRREKDLELHVQEYREDVGEKLRKALSCVFDSSDAEIKRVDTSNSKIIGISEVKEKDKIKMSNPVSNNVRKDELKRLLKHIQESKVQATVGCIPEEDFGITKLSSGIIPLVKASHEKKEELGQGEQLSTGSEDTDIKKEDRFQPGQGEQLSTGSEDTDIKKEDRFQPLEAKVDVNEKLGHVDELSPERTSLQYEGAAIMGRESLNMVHQRADALESLLELCAKLVKNEKFDELENILRPFGQESVSSRETAIWLTRNLMSSTPKYEDTPSIDNLQ